MRTRSDVSNKLIHFIHGESEDEAFSTLCKIINEKRLLGGTGYIRDSYKCVCFTEAPIPALCESFYYPELKTRYLPFGIMFEKSWIFSKGGRPVIYQPSSDYSLLDESIRWRHVRYELNNTSPIDFSWEREWRVHCDELFFTPEEATIVLPDPQWREYLFEQHRTEQEFIFQAYLTAFSEDFASQFIEEFKWRVTLLTDIETYLNS